MFFYAMDSWFSGFNVNDLSAAARKAALALEEAANDAAEKAKVYATQASIQAKALAEQAAEQAKVCAAMHLAMMHACIRPRTSLSLRYRSTLSKPQRKPRTRSTSCNRAQGPHLRRRWARMHVPGGRISRQIRKIQIRIRP